MSDDAAVEIASFEDAVALVEETQAAYDTLHGMAMAQSIMAIIPGVNYWTGLITWILALVQVLDFAPVAANLTALAAYFDDETNWPS